MSAHWYTYASPDLAAEACARQILLHLEQALAGRSTATLAISGGSTPKLMFGHLAAKRFDWSRVHLFWVDERAVAPTDAESNYLLAEEHFLKVGRFPQRNVHRIQGELRPEIAAENYTAEIEEVFGLAEGEMPHFDVIHLGLGADGHTASLFPGEPLVEDRKNIASAVYVEKLGKWRVTLLPGVLLNAKHVLMLVAGSDKAEALKAVTEGPYEPMRYPAQLVSHHSRVVTWCVDQQAASLVSA
jgi:6-phosphogluconolactonase